MSKKIDRAAHGPSWKEVILGAFLSLLLGVVLGVALLVLRPVVVAKEKPKEIDPKVVYYIEGARDTAKAKQALAKRKAFVEGQSVSVTEDELNALASPNAPATPPAAPGKAAPPKAKDGKAKEPEKAAAAAPASGDTFAVGTPNVRIAGGALQVGVPVTVNALGLDQKIIVQARGGFVKKGDVFVYEPETLYFGSCPVHRLPYVSTFVREKFISAQPIPEDIKASWPKLANVTIEEKALKLTMP